MYTIALSILLGTAVGLLSGRSWGMTWGFVLGFAAFTVTQFGVGWILRRRIQKGMDAIQMIMTEGQKRLQRKVAHWQTRPPGSIKQAQKELECEQDGFLRQALEATTSLKSYYPWSPLLRRQVATVQMQLNYQLRDFDAVDRLMPRCVMFEPITRAMKLARMYKRKASAEELEKAFRKAVKRLRYDQSTLLYALYSWILARQGNLDEAHKVLIAGCEKNDSAVLKRNLDHLANNRPKQFSNAGLGDEWYALGLEEPRVQARRQRMPRGRQV